jgi:membrane protein required for colicin V production
MSGLNVFDFVVVGILVFVTIRGSASGLVGQVVSLASVAIGWVVAARCNTLLGPMLPIEEPWNRYVAMVMLFVGVWLVFRLFNAVICAALKKMRIKEFDRQLGALVGFLKGLFVCMVITFFAVSFSEVSRSYVLSSKSGHYLALLIDKTGALIPADMSERLTTQIELFRRNVAEERGQIAEEQGDVENSQGQGTDKKSFLSNIFSFFSNSNTTTTTDNVESQNTTISSTNNTPVSKLDRAIDIADKAMQFYEQNLQTQPINTTAPLPLRTNNVTTNPNAVPIIPPDPILTTATQNDANITLSPLFSATQLQPTETPQVKVFVPINQEHIIQPSSQPSQNKTQGFDPDAWAKALMGK